MATYGPLVAGTPITWADSGGTNTMTLSALASGSARQGPKSTTLVDNTKGLPALLEVLLTVTPTSAPTDLKTVDCYLSFSDSATAGTNNPGNLSGTDATYTAGAGELAQPVFAGSLVASHDIGAAAQFQRFLVVPQDAYVSPALVNNMDVAFKTATGVTVHSITISPWYQQTS